MHWMVPTFILHTRPFRESTLILEVFTQSHGRLSLFAKGIRRSKSGQRAAAQAFVPICVSWQEKGHSLFLQALEARAGGYALMGERLWCGLYLNELLLRLLHRGEAFSNLFDDYEATLMALASEQHSEIVLRQFELKLLEHLGYAIDFKQEAHTHLPILPDQFYGYTAELGFVRASERQIEDAFLGAELQALGRSDFSDLSLLRSAKRLTRLALAPLLGDAPLQTRELFQRR
jgi:DNA repair protein RecO (recombination protein O)